MFAQLGNIVFDGLFGFNDLRFDGEEVSYAEFNLFGRKPTMQKTGVSLLEITTSITLNADFVNINDKLKALQAYKNSGEVVSLLMGSGLMIGNFVVVATPFSVDSAFPDGTFQQITIDLTLKEHVSYSIAQQQKQTAQRKAFAVGNKKPVVRKTPPPVSIERQILQDITAIKQRSAKVNNEVLAMQASPSKFNVNAIRSMSLIGESLANSLLAKFNANPDLTIKHGQIKSAATKIKTDFTGMYHLFPLFTLANAVSRNTILQASTRQLNAAATPLSKKVTARK